MKSNKRAYIYFTAIILGVVFVATTALAALCTQSPKCPMCRQHQKVPAHGADSHHTKHDPVKHSTCCSDTFDNACYLKNRPLLGLANENNRLNPIPEATPISHLAADYKPISHPQKQSQRYCRNKDPIKFPSPPLFLSNQTFLC